MRAARLFVILTLYYAAVTALVFALAALIPGFADFLPIGGAESLLAGPATDPFESIEIGANRVANLTGSVLWLLIAVTGALLTALPVSWSYMASRSRKEFDQSLVETMMVLPVIVTAIVILVHNSLALAFSLAGIVGAVRFRNTLKSSGDALYVLLSIAIGLAAGVGAIEIALVTTVVFNYLFVVLWLTDYGGVKGAHRFLRKNKTKDRPAAGDSESQPGAAPAE